MPSYVKRAEGSIDADRERLRDSVRVMLRRIEAEREEAIHDYAARFDRWSGAEYRVSPDHIRAVAANLSETFKEDFAFCLKSVQEFARRQRDTLTEFETEVVPGVTVGQKQIPVGSVGCYVPGGRYPLVSAAIMSAGTAKVAGVAQVAACAPPREGEGIFPPTLYALHAAGADEIYCVGGVQAMAAMAFGCLGMRPVDMITGPGNAYVAEAKRQLYGTVGIDLLAGPTEILIIADESSDPDLIAADLIGQAEHGPDSPAWLVTTSQALGRVVLRRVAARLERLPTRDLAEAAWRSHGEIVVVESDDEAIAVSDKYAPEHLELQTAHDDYFLARLRNYGSLFVGEQSTVAYGDKGVGTNHTLPTGGAARYTGGLWVGKFIKTVTYQRLTPVASQRIGGTMGRMCRVEGMIAHALTCEARVDRYARELGAAADRSQGRGA